MRSLALVALLGALVAAQQPATLAETLQKGQAAFDAGNFDEAAKIFAEARQLAPEAWQGHAFQALANIEHARREQNLVRRTALLRQAEAVASDLVHKTGAGLSDPFYRFLRALVALSEGRFEEAWTLFDKAAHARAALYARYEGFPLKQAAEDGAVEAAIHVVTGKIVRGEFETADPIVKRAARCLREDNPNRVLFERVAGVVAGRLGRCDEAAARFRASIELNADPAAAEELRAVLACMYFENGKPDAGDAVLAKIPAESKHPEVVAARCTALYVRALATPDDPRMDEALRHYREVMKTYPEDRVYDLVEQWADLVLAKAGDEADDAERKLLEETVTLLEREVKRRPECPGLYLKLQKCHEKLGNDDDAKRYAELYPIKKKDAAAKAQFDLNGKPRCR